MVYIDNANINKDYLGAKKLHVSRKGNSCFAKNLLKYLNKCEQAHQVLIQQDMTGQKGNYSYMLLYAKEIRKSQEHHSDSNRY